MENQFGQSDICYFSHLTIKEKGIINYGYLTIKGNVRNNGIIKVTQCVLKIRTYDQNNNIVSIDKLYVIGDIAPAEAKTFRTIIAWLKSAKNYDITNEEVMVIK